jgi:glycerol kinase
VVHATDYSNASRTQLFNIHTLAWDDKLLELFSLTPEMMPEVRSSDAFFGTTAPGLFEKEIPIAGVLGDSHAAFFAQCCTGKGMAKATYGTGSSVMMNAGGESTVYSEKVVTSVGYALQGVVIYVLEGNINCTGATIKWLVDDLELIASSKEAGALAESVESNDGVYLIPAFVGLSAPYWNSDVRAVIVNLTRGTKKAHVVRAAEESIAYQIQDVIEAMQVDSGIALQELRVDGGPTRDGFLMQFQADMSRVPVVRTCIEELSATGAMYMGGLAAGVWSSLEELEQLREVEQVFTPVRATFWRDTQYAGWKLAVNNLLAPRHTGDNMLNSLNPVEPGE